VPQDSSEAFELFVGFLDDPRRLCQLLHGDGGPADGVGELPRDGGQVVGRATALEDDGLLVLLLPEDKVFFYILEFYVFERCKNNFIKCIGSQMLPFHFIANFTNVQRIMKLG
jgi:hypothetical protein